MITLDKLIDTVKEAQLVVKDSHKFTSNYQYLVRVRTRAYRWSFSLVAKGKTNPCQVMLLKDDISKRTPVAQLLLHTEEEVLSFIELIKEDDVEEWLSRNPQLIIKEYEEITNE